MNAAFLKMGFSCYGMKHCCIKTIANSYRVRKISLYPDTHLARTGKCENIIHRSLYLEILKELNI